MRRFATTIFSIVLMSLVGCRSESTAPTAPSIVLVVIDTLRADFIGVGGFAGPVSPNLDRLAESGVVFENCFAQSPWTKPSIASLFSSLHPRSHQVLSEAGRFGARGIGKHVTDSLPPGVETLAEKLSAAGYATGAFVANPWVRGAQGFAQGFDVFDEAPIESETSKRAADDIVAAAGRWMANVAPSRPVFLYVHLMEVHGPYDASEADFAAVAESPGVGESILLPDAQFRRIPPYLKGPGWASKPDAADVRTWRARYAAGVRAADRAVGDLRRLTEQHGRFDSSLFVVTSDHGEELYDHEHWDHGYRLFEEQLHVPLVVRLPNGLQAGRRVSSIVSLVDVAPTVLTIAKAGKIEASQGVDLAPLLGGEERETVSYAGAVKWKPYMGSVRSRRHKLISEKPDKPAVLYDLAVDPKETRDLADRSTDAAAELVAMLMARRKADDEFAAKLPRVQSELPAGADEQLRSLGYLEEQ